MTTIKCHNVEIEITEERRRRIIAAKSDTNAKLIKEMAYSSDLRNNELIASYEAHISKLNAILESR